MLQSMADFFRGFNPPKGAEMAEPSAEVRAFVEPVPEAAEAKSTDYDNGLTSLLNAVRDQAVALKVEQERSASNAKRELETLTTRMTTLAPLFTKAVETQIENERTIASQGAMMGDLHRRLGDAEREAAHYRPLAVQLEDELRVERGRLSNSLRDMAELELRYAKAQRRIDDLVQQVTTTEADAKRVAEENAAFSQKIYEGEFAIETMMREAAELKSQITSLESDVARQGADIDALTLKLSAERDAASRAQMELERVQADFDLFRKGNESAVREFEGRERRTHETVAQRDWQIYDYETRHAAQESRILFLSRKNEGQREDIIRHLAHIAKLESTNRHLLDTLSRSAISIDDTAPDADRGKVSPPKLRAVQDQ